MPPKPRPLSERLWSRVVEDPNTGCWNWTGPTRNGYGAIGEGMRSGRSLRTHRVAYEEMVGPIPDDAPHLDHLCRNRLCCNPAHLEPVTQAENNRRAFENYTHCPKGHELPPKTPPGVRRPQCKVCTAEYQRRYYLRKKNSR